MGVNTELLIVSRGCPLGERCTPECGGCAVALSLVEEFNRRVLSKGGKLGDDEPISEKEFISTWGLVYRIHRFYLVRMSVVRGTIKGQAEQLDVL